ncbi:tryptophan synthase subunit alpha [Evansella tamaricis]|uniref:Tryptophan synthase alpha chain n=1 Tax=Evansella tamaricis TaxID=2069301 RepID=A0ABS6JDT7_9BACI|nr:tryptophan synthase subunit alpha [Evansella tamaricis]MBU9711816.1 tryptophan synthase subunit alpha [Evansella tamaricis]
MNRLLDQSFQNKKNLFVPYVMSGDPTMDVSIDIALTLQEAGVDAIEWGVPFSDPLADGPVIQEAGGRSLKNGGNIIRAIEGIKIARGKGLTIPVVLFTYINPILAYGETEIISKMVEAEIDGLLIPDLPLEESEEIREKCHLEGISFISLIALNSQSRMATISQHGDGFLYFVSSLGVTGARENFSDRIEESIQTVKSMTDVPVLVGFGISKRKHVKYFHTISDGVIVGSALVHLIGEKKCALMEERDKANALGEIKEFVLELIS